MKWSVNAWAFDPASGWRERAHEAREAGFEAVEVNVGSDPGDVAIDATAADLSALRRALAAELLVVSSICTELFWKYPLTAMDAARRARARAVARRCLEIGARLGARSIVVIPGDAADRGCGRADASGASTVFRESAQELAALSVDATRLGVTIGVENVHHNEFLVRPEELHSFLRELDSAAVRAHLDIGNANVASPAEGWIDCLSTLLVAIHVKDSRASAGARIEALPPGSGDVCWGAVARSLARSSFDGYAIVEQSFRSQSWDRSLASLGRAARACIPE